MDFETGYQESYPELERLILSIDRPGNYCTGTTLFCPMPSLRVNGGGMISFPIPEFQIVKLIKQAQRAPYGKGSETLIDASVRNCWEISPKHFSLSSGHWNETLSQIVALAAKGLGFDSYRISAELYKLLIYEKGGFFLPHQDTEKSPGMVATLTVSLPVFGTGGELVVRHKGDETVFEMNVEEPSGIAFAAFYSDCKHEIKPLTDGYRVSLIYNLCVTPDSKAALLGVPDYSSEVDSIALELNKWVNDSQSSEKLIWILDHEYSKHGLSFSALKNGDLAVASALRGALQDNLNIQIFAAILTIAEMYDAYEEYDYYSSRYSVSSDYETGDLIEQAIWLEGWITADGEELDFGKLPIHPDEVMPKGVLDHVVPYDEEYEDYTGNAGATVEFFYGFAALVLVKRERMMGMLSRSSPASAVDWLNLMLKQNDGCSSKQICSYAENLIDAWENVGMYEGFKGVSGMLQALKSIDNQSLSREFITRVVVPRFSGRKIKQIVSLLRTLESDDCEWILTSLIRERMNVFPTSVLDLLLKANSAMRKREDEFRPILRNCAAEVLDCLPEMLTTLPTNTRYMYSIIRPTEEFEIKPKTLVNLLMVYQRAGMLNLATAAANVLCDHATVIGFDRTVPKALAKLNNNEQIYVSEAYRILWLASIEFLLQRSEFRPEPPKDWRLDKNSDCNCMHCAELNWFCDDSELRRFSYPVNREHRQHLRQKINTLNLEIDYKTEAIGRPYTLILTKNRAGYQQKLKTFTNDVKSFEILLKTVPPANIDEQILVRARSAIARSEGFK